MEEENGVRIPLTQGYFALVSPEDVERVSQYRWCVSTDGRGRVYAKRGDYSTGKHVTIRMHRFVLGAAPGVDVDHVNGDGLDNRRSNLRRATDAQNVWNSGRRRHNTSGHKGVYRLEGKWAAAIAGTYLGLYDSPQEAARAYDTAARARFGEFAGLNFPNEASEVQPRKGGPLRNSTSGYRGVTFRKDGEKWTARITHDGKRVFLGYFNTAEEAAAARLAKAEELNQTDC